MVKNHFRSVFKIHTGETRLVSMLGGMMLLASAGSATLLALGDVRMLCIGKDDFEAILRQRPEVSLAVITVLCQRLRQRSI